jgi:hypothetical protein
MATTRIAPLALACTAAVAACGGGGGTMDPKGFCQEEVAALAERVTACRPADPGWVRTYLPLELECEAVAEMLDAGTVGFDEAKAGPCLDAARAIGCFELELAGGDLPKACRNVLVPRVDPGGACHSTSGVECVDGWCDVAACSAPGTCVAYAHQGGPCLDGARCAPGLVCGPGTCQPAPELQVLGPSEPCAIANAVCADGLYCRYDAGTATSTCQPKLGLGADCAQSFDACPRSSWCRSVGGRWTCLPSPAAGAGCAPGLGTCDRGLSCAADDAAGLTGVCTPWPGVGGECGVTAQGEELPCLGGYCDQPLVTRQRAARLDVAGLAIPTGTCQPFKALGAPCGPLDIGECGPRAVCVDGSCQRSSCAVKIKLSRLADGGVGAEGPAAPARIATCQEKEALP